MLGLAPLTGNLPRQQRPLAQNRLRFRVFKYVAPKDTKTKSTTGIHRSGAAFQPNVTPRAGRWLVEQQRLNDLLVPLGPIGRQVRCSNRPLTLKKRELKTKKIALKRPSLFSEENCALASVRVLPAETNDKQG
jgi:hypothetical protein